MAGQRVAHQRIGVQGFNQLDLGRSVVGLWSSDPNGQTLVVRGAQNDLPGYTEASAGIGCGQPGADVQLHQRVGWHRYPVLPVEPALCTHPHAAGMKTVAHSALRHSRRRRDLPGAEPGLNVQSLDKLIERGLLVVRSTPSGTPGLDRHAQFGE
jgi:hypothetical protein